MSSTAIARHYARLLSLWPKDLMRPDQSFTRAIEYRGAPYGVKPETETPKSKAKKSTPLPPATASDPQAELANINALYSLLENRYSKRYPISANVLKPASNPEYYDRLMEEIKRAPTKSWLRAKIEAWKMKIRWQ